MKFNFNDLQINLKLISLGFNDIMQLTVFKFGQFNSILLNGWVSKARPFQKRL